MAIRTGAATAAKGGKCAGRNSEHFSFQNFFESCTLGKS